MDTTQVTKYLAHSHNIEDIKLYLNTYTDPWEKSDSYATLLRELIIDGKFDIFRTTLQLMMDEHNYHPEEDSQALILCDISQKNNVELLRYLLKHVRFIQSYYAYGCFGKGNHDRIYSPIRTALKYDSLEVFKYLSRYNKPENRNPLKKDYEVNTLARYIDEAIISYYEPHKLEDNYICLAAWGKGSKIVDYLLSDTSKKIDHREVFRYALSRGNLDAIKLLVGKYNFQITFQSLKINKNDHFEFMTSALPLTDVYTDTIDYVIEHAIDFTPLDLLLHLSKDGQYSEMDVIIYLYEKYKPKQLDNDSSWHQVSEALKNDRLDIGCNAFYIKKLVDKGIVTINEADRYKAIAVSSLSKYGDSDVLVYINQILGPKVWCK